MWSDQVRAAGVSVLEHEVVKRGDGFAERARASILRLGPPVMLVSGQALAAGSIEGEEYGTLLRALEVAESMEQLGDVVVVRMPVAGAERATLDLEGVGKVGVYVMGGWKAAFALEAAAPAVAEAAPAGRRAEGRKRRE